VDSASGAPRIARPRIWGGRVAIAALLVCYGIGLNLYYPWLSSKLQLPEYPNVHPGWVALAAAWLAYLYPIFWVPAGIERPSQAVVWLLYILLFAPAIFIPHYGLSMPVTQLVLFNAVTAVLFTGLMLASRLSCLRLPRLKLNWTGYVLLVLVVGMVQLVLVVRHLGYSFRLVPITDVYGVRSEFRALVHEAGSAAVHAALWLGFGVAPLLMALGWYAWCQRKWLSAILAGTVGVLSEFYLFSESGFKSVALAPTLVLFLIFTASRARPLWTLLIWGVTVFPASFVLFEMGLRFVPLHLVRRLLVVPGLNTAYYYEFFGNHPAAMLSHSVLGWVITSPYEAAPPFVIGGAYYGSSSTSANASFWADGFANFGFGGMLLATVALAIVLWVLDCVSCSLSLRFVVPAVGMAAYALANSAFLTTLHTYGLGLLIVLLWLAPSTRPPRYDGCER